MWRLEILKQARVMERATTAKLPSFLYHAWPKENTGQILNANPRTNVEGAGTKICSIA